MVQEGKYSQAMAKAGAADPPAPELARIESDTPGPEPPSEQGSQDRDGDFRRVKGMFGAPDPAIVAGRLISTNGRDEEDDRRLKGNTREVASQIRAVRNRIVKLDTTAPPLRVIAVTSSTIAEGKTTIALNLAAALTELDSSRRVVVVDGDMPAPALHEAAGVRQEALLEATDTAGKESSRGVKPGLCEILASKDLDLNGNVYETAIEGLDIIPGRAVTAEDGYERDLNERSAELLEKLRRHYSFVIVDTPPVHVETQACIFGKFADGVLLVTRLESTPRDVVKRTIDDLKSSGAEVCGCVMTHHAHHVPSFIYKFFGTRPGHYYGYGYGYYYGYGYGYGGRKRKRPRSKDERETSEP